MSGQEFQIGDLVEVVSGGFMMKAGERYTVQRVERDGPGVYLYIDRDGHNKFCDFLFRKVEPDIEKLRQDVIDAALEWRQSPLCSTQRIWDATTSLLEASGPDIRQELVNAIIDLRLDHSPSAELTDRQIAEAILSKFSVELKETGE